MEQSILLVDDIKQNIDVLRSILGDDYKIRFALSGEKAIEVAKKHQPDLILLDIMMPGMDGFTVIKILKEDPATKNIPVIFVTANNETVDELRGFSLGAVDYITKPVVPSLVKVRVKSQLYIANQKLLLHEEVKEKTKEIYSTQVEVINMLGRAAEFKDNETGYHVKRVGAYAYLLAIAYGIDKREAELLMLASPMHDVGKIGIEDKILKKPGRLDDAERAAMNDHAVIGADIIGDQNSEVLRYAKIVAIEHHEKWNGKGYPNGIAGEDIHLFARIVAIADVFDALTSERPYKKPWPFEKAMNLLIEEKGQHFDEKLVDLFVEHTDEVKAIMEKYKETFDV